ncbi:MAG: hypothetical protein ACRBFS_17775 [Aureispira sp.]
MALQTRLEEALAELVPSDSTTAIDPVVQQELEQLVQEMEHHSIAISYFCQIINYL